MSGAKLKTAVEPRPDILTDMANAQRFAAAHGQYVRYVKKYRRWVVWDGRRWVDDNTGVVHSKIL